MLDDKAPPRSSYCRILIIFLNCNLPLIELWIKLLKFRAPAMC
jgi:hypothetical protein